MTEKYPTQHVFVTTNELLKPPWPEPTMDRKKRKRREDRFTRRTVMRRRHEFIRELVRNNMLNMKTVNKALAAKTETGRKALAKTLFPNINDFKREVWAFAYVGNGRFLYAVSRQHDEDQFVRMIGRERCLHKLRQEIRSYDGMCEVYGDADNFSYTIADMEQDKGIPRKVIAEMKRMLKRQEPEQPAPVIHLPQIEDDDCAVPDREHVIQGRESMMYAGSMYDGRQMIN